MSEYSELVKRLNISRCYVRGPGDVGYDSRGEHDKYDGKPVGNVEDERREAAQAIERLAQERNGWKMAHEISEAAKGETEQQLAEARAREERKDAALQLAFEEACPYCKEGIPTDKEWEHGNKDGIDRKGLMHPHRNLSGVLGGGYVKCRAWKAREALATPAPEPRLHINVVSMAESDKPLKVVLGKDSEGKE